ncbi:hypothetical protein ACNTMW_10070 [Planosporangium sp. 12N6]|uniref:hypothetical protein n=1 Tax=Planosporangium spinosum TaxID=3402278 RepID=UPI003CF31E02
MTRTRIGIALVVGFAGLVGLTACGREELATPTTLVADTARQIEVQGLDELGFDTSAVVADPVAAPAPAASPSTPGTASSTQSHARRGPARRLLRKNTLHGEAVVKTKEGTKTVDFQRGTVTAIDDRTVTVRSTDGFTLAWTFGSPIKVVEHRTAVQPSAVKAGTEVGLAGTKDGDTTTAHLIVIR